MVPVDGPGGTSDNSPPLQRRVCASLESVPEARLKLLDDLSGVPAGRGYSAFVPDPALEAPGYYQSSLRDAILRGAYLTLTRSARWLCILQT